MDLHAIARRVASGNPLPIPDSFYDLQRTLREMIDMFYNIIQMERAIKDNKGMLSYVELYEGIFDDAKRDLVSLHQNLARNALKK